MAAFCSSHSSFGKRKTPAVRPITAGGITVCVVVSVYLLVWQGSRAPETDGSGLPSMPILLAPASDGGGSLLSRGLLSANPSAEEENGARMTVRGGKKPGSGWGLPPTPEDQFVTEGIQRVILVGEACLPKIDGVSKTLFLTAQHNLNLGRDILIMCPATSLYGYRENDPSLLPQRTSPVLPGQPQGSIRVQGVSSFRLPRFPYETRLGMPGPWLVDEMERFKPDLVQLFSPAVLGSVGPLLKAQRPDVPLIANFQTDIVGYMAEYQYPSVFEGAVWSLFRWIHNSADLTLTPSHAMMRQLRAVGIERQRLWTRGIDTEKFNPGKYDAGMRKTLLHGQPEGTMVAVYVGRIAAEKHCDFLAGVAELEGVQLVFVGDGPDRPSLMDKLAHTNTLFMGMVIGDELPKIYASADLFVFTGTKETAGNVVREALASGTPVVLPNSGGVVDTVLDGLNGILCEPNVASYTAAAKRLRDHPEQLQALKKHVPHAAELIPSWLQVMDQTEHYYQEAVVIAEERGRQPGGSARWPAFFNPPAAKDRGLSG